MCGIFGVFNNRDPKENIKLIRRLGKYSETRGKDASGLASGYPFQAAKSSIGFSESISSRKWQKFFRDFTSKASDQPHGYSMLIGHTRLATNGSAEVDANNQPVVLDSLIAVHNGIICNTDYLKKQYTMPTNPIELDSEVLFRCVEQIYAQQSSQQGPGIEAWKYTLLKIYEEIEGAASIAMMTRNNELILATNTGSLYTVETDHGFMFSSEKLTLEDTLRSSGQEQYISRICSSPPLTIIYVTADKKGDLVISRWEKLPKKPLEAEKKSTAPAMWLSNDYHYYLKSDQHLDRMKAIQDRVSQLQRCSNCLLPETHPYIHFDEKGVCNFCNHYQPNVQFPMEEIYALADRIRSPKGQPDCIVPISGGRDSTYVLSIVKNELKLNPVAYTYDWGLVTDLARRNQSRLCQELGVEHIVVSADIRKKRKFVRQNVTAWLHKPDLGVIPLFMAGDKMAFGNAEILSKKLGIQMMFFGMNEFENNDFKEGFCGVRRMKFGKDGRFYHLDSNQQIKMISHYFKEFITNPKYLNSSLFDTAKAYMAYYLSKHNYTYLFKYFPWNEDELNEHIIKNFNFELSPDTDTTWRIGDGTAAFYNYIYHSLAGFSEADPMRSNQIREGHITREQGLHLIQRDNRPRYESIEWYCNTIGLDPRRVLETIDKMPFVENKWTF